MVEDYRALAVALPAPPADAWLSVDLTHLALDTDPSGAADRPPAIAKALPEGRRVQVGAEDAGRADAVLACVLDVTGRGLADRLGATVQANLLRSPADADTLTAGGIHVRLVKGAYVETTGAHPYGNSPTLLTCGWGSASPRPAPPGRWPPTTAGYARHSYLRWDRCPSSNCSVYAPRFSPSFATAACPRVYVPYGPGWFRYWLRRLAESRGA